MTGNVTGVQSLTGTANQITVSGATGAVTLSLPSTVTVPGSLNVTTDLIVTGNLTVNGNTTTVNSNTISIDDPVIILGTSGGVPISVSDGGKDRGIAFNYYDTAGRTGFFGYDASANEFIFLNRATVANDVATGLSFGNVRVGGSLKLQPTNTSLADTITGSGAGNVHTLSSDFGGELVSAGTYPSVSGYVLRSNESLGSPTQPTWVDPTAIGFSVYSAGRLATSRTIGLTGQVFGSASFDGTSNINISTTITNPGVTGIVAGSGISVSGQTGNVTISNTGVLSVNGSTGTITNVAKTNVAQTFTQQQSFASGISAAGGLTLFSLNDVSYLQIFESDPINYGVWNISANNPVDNSTIRINSPFVEFGDLENYWSTPTSGYRVFISPEELLVKVEAIGGLFETSTDQVDIVATPNASGLNSGRINLTCSYFNINPNAVPLNSTVTLQGYIVEIGDVVGDYTNTNVSINVGTGIITHTSFGNIFSAGATFSGNIHAPNIVNSVNGQTGDVTISGGGVTGLVAGSGISVSGQTGNVTITNTGVLSVNGATGAINLVAGSNITITPSGKTFTIASTASGGGAATGFTYSSSAPGSPVIGDRWMDSDTGREYVYINDGSSSQWIEPTSSNGLGGVTYYAATNYLEFGSTGSFVKLGVNNTSPQYTLDVNGIINAPVGISAGSINGSGATFSGAVVSDGGFRISSGAINTQSGTTYSLLSSDNGKIITMNNVSSSTVTIPSGLPIGYNTTVIQLGTGQVGFTGSGTTLNSSEGKLNIATRYAAANIISYSTNVFVIAGGLTG